MHVAQGPLFKHDRSRMSTKKLPETTADDGGLS